MPGAYLMSRTIQQLDRTLAQIEKNHNLARQRLHDLHLILREMVGLGRSHTVCRSDALRRCSAENPHKSEFLDRHKPTDYRQIAHR